MDNLDDLMRPVISVQEGLEGTAGAAWAALQPCLAAEEAAEAHLSL